MRTLWIFEDKRPGTRLNVKVDTADPNVVTLGGVLQKVTSAGNVIAAKWTRAQLAAGVSEVLGLAEGYNVVILPLIQPGTNPSLDTGLSFSDGEQRVQAEPLFNNEPVGWRIFMA